MPAFMVENEKCEYWYGLVRVFTQQTTREKKNLFLSLRQRPWLKNFNTRNLPLLFVTLMCFGARNQVCGPDLFRARCLLQSHM